VSVKHRLKVVQHDDDIAPRPLWHWVGFGTVATFAAWLPLAYAAQAAASRLVRTRLGVVDNAADAAARVAGLPPDQRMTLHFLLWTLPALALALAATAGGFLVGRWGDGAGPKEGALAGAGTVIVAGMLTCVASGASWVPLVGLVIAVPAAALGAKLGVLRRGRTLA
jgi:hypothetical protein